MKRIAPRRRRVGALSLGRNPLRRPVDRIEAGIFAGLLVVFLIGAPLLAIVAGRWEHGAAVAEQRAQRSVHLVTAVLLQDVPDVMAGDASYAGALARWTVSDGKSRVGEVIDVAGTKAGTRLQIWVDGSGRQVEFAPLTRRGVETRVITAAALTAAAFAVMLLSAALCLRYLVNRRRLAAWDAAWADIGPGWTRRG